MGLILTPDIADALYDGLDLMQNSLAGVETEEAVVATVMTNLEKIVTSFSASKTNGKPLNLKLDKRKTHVSDEIPALHIENVEISAVVPPPPVVPELPPPPRFRTDNTGLTAPVNPITVLPADMDSELMQIFRIEVDEHLTNLNNGLLQVEMMEGSEKLNLLREMNRMAHSMKGAARAVGFGVIETISHYLEEIFHGVLHQGKLLTPDTADALYDGLDLIQNALAGDETNHDILVDVLANLERIAHLDRHPEVHTPIPDTHKTSDSTELPILTVPELLDIHAADTDELPAVAAPPHLQDLMKTPTREFSARPPAGRPPVPMLTSTLDTSTVTPTMMLRPPEETLRVAVAKLDHLMAEASELLVAKMQAETRQRGLSDIRRIHARWRREWRTVRTAYIRLARRMQEDRREMPAEMTTLFKFLQANEDYLAEASRALTSLAQTQAQDNMHLTTAADSLQNTVASLRMMPFETITSGFQRMVRDLARDTDKQVFLDIIGAQVDIDKTVLDALKDPLMHLLRNAVDHGIEAPAKREAKGKSPVGRVIIQVEQRGSELIIRVRDDGNGIDVNRIRRKAVLKNVLTEAEAMVLSDEDTRMLIFQSGFSTSDQVTSISGRGLGMDIVRSRVESLRGRISIHSVMGEGTTFTMNVPVSLTRIRAILLRVGDEQYALPSVMVARMETLPRSAVFTAEGQTMLMLNQRPMPLISLGLLLDIPGSGVQHDIITVVAVETGERIVAFEVDTLYSEMELVLKPLGPELTNVAYVAGAALMGSGEVIIVLDGSDLVRAGSGTGLPLRKQNNARAVKTAPRRMRVLVVDDSITTRTLEKNILEAVGFEVHVAIDGVEAWAILTEFTPDVIISDVEMPNMNGLELARRVKSHPHTRDIPLILLTSLAKPEQREEGLRAGADAYLVKSQFDQNELLATIQSVM
jgi:two-component system chemotaxis sensor kinase CheA